MASASYDGIKLWDLSDNSLAATLTARDGKRIYALALYVRNGVPILASGSDDGTIRLWDLSTDNHIKTLSGHRKVINSLTVYEANNKTILISGSGNGTIKLWDLDTYATINTLQGHQSDVCTLCVYDHDDKSYLASGSHDKSIKIWNLDDYSLVKTVVNTDVDMRSSLLTVQSGSQQILVSGHGHGHGHGKIKLWSVGDYECIGTIDAQSNYIVSLDVLEYDGKVCLVSASNDRSIKIWDIESHSVITTLQTDSYIYAMTVFMNGDQAYLASGGDGLVELWME